MTRRLQPSRRPGRGFTLIELTLVIVIAGILAATIAVFMRPAIDSYIATGTRAGHPIQSQEGSNASVNAGNDKRKRQDSTGYVMAQI